jgi:hypothetical protein
MSSRPLLLLALLSIISFAGSGVAFAQSGPRFEVGGHLSTLTHSGFTSSTSLGVGGRFTVNLAPWIAAEAEITFFPHDDVLQQPAPTLGVEYRRRRTEAFFGGKIGMRGERFGLFAKVRPGLASLSHTGFDCKGDVCALILLALPEYRTEFALDYGGVVEFYPSPRFVTRFDFGDTMIRHRSFAPPCRECTSHNFSSRFGFGVRF